MTRDVLLVGSVGLSDAAEVFRAAAETLGERLPRIPDGETGYARSVWIQCQIPFFLGNPALEMVEPDPESPGGYREARIPSGGIYSRTRAGSYRGQARLRPGMTEADVKFSNVGYGDWAIESYAVFTRLKAERVIPQSTRLQVSIPSPRATLGTRVMPAAMAAVAKAYDAALAGDINRMASAIPGDELAIQWDCTEPVAWDGMGPEERAEVVDRLVQYAGLVPEGVELGYHLCYGDFEHQHGRQPPHAGEMVDITNAVASRVRRPIDWVHLPVPRDRTDYAYFEPLADLTVSNETRVYLGLIHYTDGLEGALKRITRAEKFISDFGIATECGFGRRPKNQDIYNLMALHAQVADS